MSVPNILLIPQASVHYQLWWHLTWHSIDGTNIAITIAQKPPQIDFLHDFNKLGSTGMSFFKK